MNRRSHHTDPHAYRPSRVFGWVVLIALLLLGALPLSATARETPANDQQTAIPLVPAIAAAPAAETARGVFLHETVRITIPAARTIWLAASPDGTGRLCTDDQATLTFTTPSGQHATWSHTFTSADRQSVVCLPPQDLTALLPPGSYTVEVVLTDTIAPTSHSTPYLLVVVPRSTPPTTTATSASPTPSPTPAPSPTAPARDSPSAVPPPTPPTTPPPTPSADSAFPWGLVSGIGGGLLVLILMRIGATRHRPPIQSTPYSAGILEVFDQETREQRTMLLTAASPNLVLTRQPLHLGPPATDPPPETTWRLALHVTAQGLQVQEQSGPATPHLLRRGETWSVAEGTIALRYR